jgi:hypothetical protein
MEKGTSVTHIDSEKDQLREDEGMEYERDSPSTWKGRGRRLYAQSGDQGRGVSATSKQAGSGNELRDVLVREKGA